MLLSTVFININTAIYEYKYSNLWDVGLKGCIGLPWWLSAKESTCNAGDPGSFSGLGRSPGRGHGNPLQYSCLENLMDRGAWRATVRGVTQSQIWLEQLSSIWIIVYFISLYKTKNEVELCVAFPTFMYFSATLNLNPTLNSASWRKYTRLNSLPMFASKHHQRFLTYRIWLIAPFAHQQAVPVRRGVRL